MSLNLDGRLCVVIGAPEDREAIEKTAALEESGAVVRRLTDPHALRDEDVRDAFFVISTPQDEALSARLRGLADRHRFLLCCIDQPVYGFVAMTAVAKAGPVRVAISTAGLAPRVGKKLKEALQRAMDGTFAAFVGELARRRSAVRQAHPHPDESNIRRSDAIEAAKGFEADVRFEYPKWFRDADR
ncbi:MAG TPA: NAD(P)-dependent oxidoreductase [Candidatus Baltobacteraceae bacterium]|nr:NAD(P)-dependent oxidoreductase [Candidatus Baltobacteraceae bacterium]